MRYRVWRLPSTAASRDASRPAIASRLRCRYLTAHNASRRCFAALKPHARQYTQSDPVRLVAVNSRSDFVKRVVLLHTSERTAALIMADETCAPVRLLSIQSGSSALAPPLPVAAASALAAEVLRVAWREHQCLFKGRFTLERQADSRAARLSVAAAGGQGAASSSRSFAKSSAASAN